MCELPSFTFVFTIMRSCDHVPSLSPLTSLLLIICDTSGTMSPPMFSMLGIMLVFILDLLTIIPSTIPEVAPGVRN